MENDRDTSLQSWKCLTLFLPRYEDRTDARRDGERHCRAERCRVVFDDLHREATRVAVSPSGDLAAVSDTVGRVLLVDTKGGRVVRLFKGVRKSRAGREKGDSTSLQRGGTRSRDTDPSVANAPRDARSSKTSR